jgi:hypothetical protein
MSETQTLEAMEVRLRRIAQRGTDPQGTGYSLVTTDARYLADAADTIDQLRAEVARLKQQIRDMGGDP